MFDSVGSRAARKWDEPPLVTAARALVFWPLFAVALITFIFAPGIIGGALVVAAVRGAGGRIDGRIVMGIGGVVSAAGAFAAAQADMPGFALVYALITHLGLAVGVRFGSEAPVRGGVYTHAGLAVLIALTAVFLGPVAAEAVGVVDPAGDGFTASVTITLAMTTVVSGVGLGLALAPRRPRVSVSQERWGPLPGLGLAVAGSTVLAYRFFFFTWPSAFEEPGTTAVWPAILTAVASVFALVAAGRAVTLFRLRRAPELHVREASRAQVVRADGSRVPVHVDAASSGVTTLLAYELGGGQGDAYRGGMDRVTAERVFRGTRREAIDLVISSTLCWVGWAVLTASVASFGF